jgi:hypothetical protein
MIIAQCAVPVMSRDGARTLLFLTWCINNMIAGDKVAGPEDSSGRTRC